MIDPSIRLIYYFLINKGFIFPDREAFDIRGKFAITITDKNANNIIQQLLEDLATNAKVDKKKVKANISNFDFCNFILWPPQKTKVRISKPIKVRKNFGTTFWRSKND